MARFETKTISRRTVEALQVEKDTVFWDSELSGFGVRVYPSGSKYYVVQTRAGGRAAKRVTVGRHGVVTAEEARRRAALIIARIKAGEEPVPEPPAEGPRVAELARAYLEEHVAVRCKPKTVEMYGQAVRKHILPALGKMPALAVERAHVAGLHHKLRDTPIMANRVVDTLSRITSRNTSSSGRSARPVKLAPAKRIARAWQVSTVTPRASSPINSESRRRISTAAWRL